MSPNGDIQKVQTSHDIGLVTGMKLVAIAWAAAIPFIVPAWMIIQGEIKQLNQMQDREIAAKYVSKDEYVEFKNTVRDLQLEVHKLRDAIEFAGLNAQSDRNQRK
jgi:cell division protein FtsB